MQPTPLGDTSRVLGIANVLVSSWVKLGDHASCDGRVLHRFIDDFQHADGRVVGVAVDSVGDPGEEVVGAVVLEALEEAR